MNGLYSKWELIITTLTNYYHYQHYFEGILEDGAIYVFTWEDCPYAILWCSGWIGWISMALY
jgi:hypothetical protein